MVDRDLVIRKMALILDDLRTVTPIAQKCLRYVQTHLEASR